MKKLVSLVEVRENKNLTNGNKYYLQETLVNPSHVVFIRPDNSIANKLEESGWPENLDKRTCFTKVYMNLASGWSSPVLVAVGTLDILYDKLVIDE